MKNFLVLIILLMLAGACEVYTHVNGHDHLLREGTKVKVEVPKAPDERGTIHERTQDSILIFFDRPPGKQDLEWYSIHDDRLRSHNKFLSILAGIGATIVGTFYGSIFLAYVSLPILLLLSI